MMAVDTSRKRNKRRSFHAFQIEVKLNHVPKRWLLNCVYMYKVFRHYRNWEHGKRRAILFQNNRPTTNNEAVGLHIWIQSVFFFSTFLSTFLLTRHKNSIMRWLHGERLCPIIFQSVVKTNAIKKQNIRTSYILYTSPFKKM